MNNAELKRAVIQREIDIAIARPSLNDDELKSEPLHREPLIWPNAGFRSDSGHSQGDACRAAIRPKETFSLSSPAWFRL